MCIFLFLILATTTSHYLTLRYKELQYVILRYITKYFCGVVQYYPIFNLTHNTPSNKPDL